MEGLYTKSTHTKLIALFILPFLIFLVVSAIQIKENANKVADISKLENLVTLATHISSLIHETQKERGSTGIYLSSQGTLFSDQLRQQRIKTDTQIGELHDFLSTFKNTSYSDTFNHSLTKSIDKLVDLEGIRKKITLAQITTEQAISLYTKINGQLLDTVGIMVLDSSEADLTRAMISYASFLKGKEIAGIERAVLSSTFTQDYFSNGMYRHFVKLVTEQNSYHREFSFLTNAELVKKFNVITKGYNYENVNTFRNIAHKQSLTGGFNVNAEDWFNVKTKKIDQLKTLEDLITVDLISRSTVLKRNRTQAQSLWLILIFITTAASVMFGIWMMHRINYTFNRRLEEYHTLFEKSSAGMVIIDPKNQQFISCNTAFSQMLEYSKIEITSLNLLDIQPTESSNRVISSYDNVTATNHQGTEDVLLLRKDGSVFYGEINFFPILIEETRCTVGNIKDITQRRDAQINNQVLIQENRQLAQINYKLQERERREIARELHDELGQSMVGIMMQADHIQQHIRNSDYNSISSAAASIAKTIRSLINATRDLTNKLRPVTLDQLGLVDALSELVSNWKQLNIDTYFSFETKGNIPEVPDQIAICLYRIVQESLTNISKHASANNVIVSLIYDSNIDIAQSRLILSIIDNGIGLDNMNTNGWGMGIINMRERVQSLGGTFDLISEENIGVKIIANIPMSIAQEEMKENCL